MNPKDRPELIGSSSAVPDRFRHLRAFARVVHVDPATGAETEEEQEFIRVELAIAWLRWQLDTFAAVRGEVYFRDDKGRRVDGMTVTGD